MEENYKNKILLGNSIKELQLIPSNIIDMVITSPPYWNLRDYHNESQIGTEANYQEYISNLLKVFLECKRVIKNSGSIWVNMGDSYGKNKSLYAMPDRLKIAMIDSGFICRNEIIWHKPNQMPSSSKNRFTVDFEKLYFFTKQENYYFEQQLDPYTKPMNRWGGIKLKANGDSDWDNGTGQSTYRDRNMRPNPNGKNKRCVWSINTKPLKEAHFAIYPEELIETPIKACCPKNGIVLDPFFGSGTTGVVAKKLNRNYLGIELNLEYIKIAEKRLDFTP
jgi:site-specific DNA-methyltransferase (adenine-specific)